MRRVCSGVDEAGRGPWAGPVIAAAVILDDANPIAGLRDSKKLSAQQRDDLYALITERSLAWAVGRAEVEEIDKLNILRATLLAMQRALETLSPQPTLIIVDGTHCPTINFPAELKPLIRGDQLEPAISAASIIAKVTRDREMQALDAIYPAYGFAAHKGYGTAQHQAALKLHGVCPIHRQSFRPIREILRGAI